MCLFEKGGGGGGCVGGRGAWECVSVYERVSVPAYMCVCVRACVRARARARARVCVCAPFHKTAGICQQFFFKTA